MTPKFAKKPVKHPFKGFAVYPISRKDELHESPIIGEYLVNLMTRCGIPNQPGFLQRQNPGRLL